MTLLVSSRLLSHYIKEGDIENSRVTYLKEKRDVLVSTYCQGVVVCSKDL